MKTTPTTIHLDDLKKELTKELSSMGLSINGSNEPTEATKKALVAAQAKELGIIPDDSPSFDNMNELKNYLGKD